MRFFVRKPDARSDYEADEVEANVVKCVFEENWEILHTNKGVFKRYECYSSFSPYGWEKVS